MMARHMEVSNDSRNEAGSGGRWWREWELGLLVLLVSALYFSRLDTLTIRGEESRRARIGIEMRQSGDWLVPREQGDPLLSRPPLQNWVIVGLGQVLGGVNAWAIRLPSALSVLALAVLIYGYSRTFLSRFGAFVASAAFASMAQVLELGRLGETELLFTLFVAGSLLVWHWGYHRCWHPVLIWAPAYLLVALGTLTKGPQAPVYFAASVGLFLLLARRWRFALSWAHAAGILLLLAVWGAWHVPFALETGWSGIRRIYWGDVGPRFDGSRWVAILSHMARYPLEVLARMLPWSVLLWAYVNRDFRRRIGSAGNHVLFLACAIGVTFPTVWLAPGAKSRYFLPLFPCFAILIGLVVERCTDAGASVACHRQQLWRRFLLVLAAVMPAVGLVVLAGTVVDDGSSPLGQPTWFAVVYLASTVLLSAVILGARRAAGRGHRIAEVVGVAAFMGLTLVGVLTNSLARRSVDAATAVARLKQQLPPDVRMVSLAHTHHLFAYYYGDFIEPVGRPRKEGDLGPEVTYFCFYNAWVSSEELPFAHETLAVIPCGRFRDSDSIDAVTVARRLPNRPVVARADRPAPRR